MKKIVLLLIAVVIIVLPNVAMAGGTPKKINPHTFRMQFEGKKFISSADGFDFYISRYYDSQTSTMCYVIKYTSSHTAYSMSCVRIKKKNCHK
jgi:hypothetical protein